MTRATRSGPVRWYDIAASATYASHFVAGLTIAGVLWLRDRGAVRSSGSAAT